MATNKLLLDTKDPACRTHAPPHPSRATGTSLSASPVYFMAPDTLLADVNGTGASGAWLWNRERRGGLSLGGLSENTAVPLFFFTRK